MGNAVSIILAIVFVLLSAQSRAEVERFIQGESELKNCFVTICKVNRNGDYGAVYESNPADDVIFCQENYNRAGVFHRDVVLAPDALNAEVIFDRKYSIDQDRNFMNLVKGPIFCISNQEAQENFVTPDSPIISLHDAYRSDAVVDNQDGSFRIVNPYFQVPGGEFYFLGVYNSIDLCPFYGFARKTKDHVEKTVKGPVNLRDYGYNSNSGQTYLYKIYDETSDLSELDDIAAELECTN